MEAGVCGETSVSLLPHIKAMLLLTLCRTGFSSLAQGAVRKKNVSAKVVYKCVRVGGWGQVGWVYACVHNSGNKAQVYI